VIFIHGYNNTFDYAAYSTGNICRFLGVEFVCVALSWPDGGSSGALMGCNVDRESGELAVSDMRKAIRAIGETNGIARMRIIAHSRGTDVTASALQQLGIESYAMKSSLSQKAEDQQRRFPSRAHETGLGSFQEHRNPSPRAFQLPSIAGWSETVQSQGLAALLIVRGNLSPVRDVIVFRCRALCSVVGAAAKEGLGSSWRGIREWLDGPSKLKCFLQRCSPCH
jgi:pimeloyl-ACP methyl ester carboxylesterase